MDQKNYHKYLSYRNTAEKKDYLKVVSDNVEEEEVEVEISVYSSIGVPDTSKIHPRITK